MFLNNHIQLGPIRTQFGNVQESHFLMHKQMFFGQAQASRNVVQRKKWLDKE